MEIAKLNNKNINTIKNIYEKFTQTAQNDFLFEIPPLDFEDFKFNFQNNFVQGYCDTQDNAGFLLYSDKLTQAIEITLVYTSQTNDKTAFNNLLGEFLTDIKQKYKNKIISYPLMGIQDNFSNETTQFGFSLINESILELNNIKTESIKPVSVIDENYSFDYWKNEYSDDAVKIIFNEFKDSNDAKFDLRFKNTEGTANVLKCIIKGYYGNFVPQYVTVLKYKNKPCGYCFLNFTTDTTANIPLLVIAKEHQNKGLGAIILQNTINNLLTGINNANLLNVTCDTNNQSAMKTYLKAGFKQTIQYKHAYLEI